MGQQALSSKDLGPQVPGLPLGVMWALAVQSFWVDFLPRNMVYYSRGKEGLGMV